jgi:hypothetical protein
MLTSFRFRFLVSLEPGFAVGEDSYCVVIITEKQATFAIVERRNVFYRTLSSTGLVKEWSTVSTKAPVTVYSGNL